MNKIFCNETYCRFYGRQGCTADVVCMDERVCATARPIHTCGDCRWFGGEMELSFCLFWPEAGDWPCEDFKRREEAEGNAEGD